MAGIVATAEVSGDVYTTAAKTLIQLVAASDHRVRVKSIEAYFDGPDTDDNLVVQLVRQSDEGTSSALTPKKLDDSADETLQTAARHDITSEPTTGDVLWSASVNPATGISKTFPPGFEPMCGGGDRIGLRIDAGATVTGSPTASGTIVFEE